MANAPAASQTNLASVLSLAARDSAYGTLDPTAQKHSKNWHTWVSFCQDGGVDPLFQGLTTEAQVQFLGAFAAFIRQGGAGRGSQVRAQQVQNALCSVGQGFELAHRPNPLHSLSSPSRNPHYHLQLANQLKGYKRADPPVKPQLAVPVSLPHLAVDLAYATSTGTQAIQRQAAADLINIAFYFLLRVGEYTSSSASKPPPPNQRQTTVFKVRDCTFWTARRQPIPSTSPLSVLQNAHSATLTITNQKNGIKGQHIHHFATKQRHCPIKTLARRVHHIMTNKGSPDDLICTYYPSTQTRKYVTSNIINTAVKTAADALGLFRPDSGYTPQDVSSHSLRAGGAMAMHLNGISSETIKKQGRWRSDTFMRYIHEQLSGHSLGLAQKMSTHIPFHNMAGPSILCPAA